MPFYTVKEPVLTQWTGHRITRDSRGRLWVVYDDSRAGNWYIFASYSDDDGATWTEETVTGIAEMNTRGIPSIAPDSLGNIHIVYTDANGRSTYRRRTASGWESAEYLYSPSEESSIAIDSQNNIHVSLTKYFAPNTEGIIYRQKTGGVWQPIEGVIYSLDQMNSRIAVDLNDDVHVVWFGKHWGTYGDRMQLVYRKRTSGSWDGAELLTDPNRNQYYADIIVSTDGIVHVVWEGQGVGGSNPTIGNIKHIEKDGGWSGVTHVTDVGAQQRFPAIALDSNDDLFVFWRGKPWGINTTFNNIEMIKRASGVWQARVGITDRGVDQDWPSPMSALFPRIGGNSIAIPLAGYIVHFQGSVGTVRSEVWLSADLDLAAIALGFSKAYVIA